MTIKEFYVNYSSRLYDNHGIDMELKEKDNIIRIKVDDDMDDVEIDIHKNCILAWARKRLFSIDFTELNDKVVIQLISIYDLLTNTIKATRLAILEK